MADSTVAALTASDALTGPELFYADGFASAVAADVKVTATQILAWATKGLTITATTGTFTLTNAKTFSVTGTLTLAGTDGKTLTVSNSLTLAGTDGSTLNIGTGGTLGTAALKATGTSGNTIPLLDGNNTWSGTNAFGISTATSLALGGATIDTHALAVAGTISFGPWTFDATNGTLNYLVSGVSRFRLEDYTAIKMVNSAVIQWSNSGSNLNTIDTIICRDAANTPALRNGTAAQAFNWYDTWASATDYHRGALATARATLSGVTGASVTATGLIPDGAVVVGVTTKVTTGLGITGGTTGYAVGTGADPNRWGDIVGTAAGTSSDNRDWTSGLIDASIGATNVILTAAGGNFDGTGVIYVSVQYLIGQCD